MNRWVAVIPEREVIEANGGHEGQLSSGDDCKCGKPEQGDDAEREPEPTRRRKAQQRPDRIFREGSGCGAAVRMAHE